MRLLPSTLLATLTLALLAGTSSANAQGHLANDVHGLFGSPRTCSHVIDLLLRYGSGGSNGYRPSGGLIQPTAYGPAVVPHSEIGDLELLGVSLQSDGDAGCGPTFGITVRNNSCREVTDFRISIVGVLHRIHPLSPTTVHCVERIAAGETVECSVSLPVEVLSMGRAGDQVLCFQTLVVAIDSYDQLFECNESNNLKVLAVSDVPRVVVEGGEVVSEDPASIAVGPSTSDAAPDSTMPSDPNGQGIDVGPQSNPPADAAPDAGIDNLDFNNLDLSEASAAVWQF